MIVTFILLTDTNTHVECSTFSEDYEYDCQGNFSKLTYQDCQGNFFNTTGCYFLENFAQYRACASICNNVIEGSLDEEKCRLYCPGKETEYTPCHMYFISMQSEFYWGLKQHCSTMSVIHRHLFEVVSPLKVIRNIFWLKWIFCRISKRKLWYQTNRHFIDCFYHSHTKPTNKPKHYCIINTNNISHWSDHRNQRYWSSDTQCRNFYGGLSPSLWKISSAQSWTQW